MGPYQSAQGGGTKPGEPQLSCTVLDCDGVQVSIRGVREGV